MSSTWQHVCFHHSSLTTAYLSAIPLEKIKLDKSAERVQRFNTFLALLAEYLIRRTLRSLERIAIVASRRGEFHWAPHAPRTLRVILTMLLQYLLTTPLQYRTRLAIVTDLPAARAPRSLARRVLVRLHELARRALVRLRELDRRVLVRLALARRGHRLFAAALCALVRHGRRLFADALHALARHRRRLFDGARDRRRGACR